MFQIFSSNSIFKLLYQVSNFLYHCDIFHNILYFFYKTMNINLYTILFSFSASYLCPPFGRVGIYYIILSFKSQTNLKYLFSWPDISLLHCNKICRVLYFNIFSNPSHSPTQPFRMILVGWIVT